MKTNSRQNEFYIPQNSLSDNVEQIKYNLNMFENIINFLGPSKKERIFLQEQLDKEIEETKKMAIEISERYNIPISSAFNGIIIRYDSNDINPLTKEDPTRVILKIESEEIFQKIAEEIKPEFIYIYKYPNQEYSSCWFTTNETGHLRVETNTDFLSEKGFIKEIINPSVRKNTNQNIDLLNKLSEEAKDKYGRFDSFKLYSLQIENGLGIHDHYHQGYASKIKLIYPKSN